MSDGIGDFAYEDPNLDLNIDNDDDNDQDVDTTRPFYLGAASTPYQGGEQYEMQTMQHEQSGLPSYDERTHLLSESDAKSDALFRSLEALRD